MDKGKGSALFFNVLCLILTIVLILSVMKFCFNGSSVSFAEFLEYVSKTPQIDVSYQKYAIVLGDWGAFNFLKYFFEALATIINVGVWLCRNIANLLVVITYYVTFLFV